MTFRMCATPHCPNQAATGLRLCLDCDAEEYAIREAVNEGIDPGSLLMPCKHPQWAATSNGSPLVASTQHCRMCSGEIPEVKVEIVHKNVY
jgi:hypothetical protein